jgi:type IV secretory pathway VirJ component
MRSQRSEMPKALWPRKGRPRRRSAVALGVAAGLFVGLLGFTGYLGGPVFTDLRPAPVAPPPALRGVAVALLSGDMGFRMGMGRAVADRLAAQGVPVVGVNTLTYFRIRRTPREAAGLIEAAERRALAVPGTTRLVLVGQSFGADMLQAGLAALPDPLRRRIALVALVVPGATIVYRASPSNLFGLERPEVDGFATARRLDWVPVLCVYGIEERASLCPGLRQPNVRRIGLPGGHPLRRDSDRLYRTLIDAVAGALK